MRVPPAGRKRLFILGTCLMSGFSLLIAQFYRLQIVEGEQWAEKAQQQHYFHITEPFLRGRFFSNNSVRGNHCDKEQPLVVDIQKFHLHIDPFSISSTHADTIAEELAQQLRLSEQKRDQLRQQFNKQGRSRRLAMWLEASRRDAINSWWFPYAAKHKIPKNAIYFVSDYQRSYPFGKMLGAVLHTVQNRKESATGQAIPTGGLEYTFNSLLRGRVGKRRLMRSPRHAFATGEVITHPQNGADIYLTINHCLQAICEQEVERGVKQSQAQAGWAVMMDPSNGHILALAQYPDFDPRDYRRYFNTPNLVAHTRLHAISDAQEPGSVIKPLTLAAALLANEALIRRGESPLFDPDAKMATTDGTFPGRSRPLKDTRLHKWMNMDMALQKSSNIYVARLVEKIIDRLGPQWYRAVLENCFGFGTPTNVELPSENVGLLPTPGKRYPNGKLEWSVPTPFSLAMGYNLQANSLQTIRAFATLANGGLLVEPTLVRHITQEGRLITAADDKVPRRVLPRAIVKRVVEALKYVTKKGGGGWRGEVWGYTEAGKTGTVRKLIDGAYSTKKYCCSFVGFPVVEAPPFVLLVVLDEPDTAYRQGVGHTYYGSIAAAPIFKEICSRSLQFLGIAPDDPHGYPPNDPRFDKESADWHREAMRLQEKYERWNMSN